MHLAQSNYILMNKHCSPLLPHAKRYPQHKLNSFHSSSLQQHCHFCYSLSSATLILAGCTPTLMGAWECFTPTSKILQGLERRKFHIQDVQVWDTHCSVCNIHQAHAFLKGPMHKEGQIQTAEMLWEAKFPLNIKVQDFILKFQKLCSWKFKYWHLPPVWYLKMRNAQLAISTASLL